MEISKYSAIPISSLREELDRFARNRYDSAHYKNILKKNGVRVVSATEHITEGPEGIILESMLEGMAEYYSAELAEKEVKPLVRVLGSGQGPVNVAVKDSDSVLVGILRILQRRVSREDTPGAEGQRIEMPQQRRASPVWVFPG